MFLRCEGIPEPLEERAAGIVDETDVSAPRRVVLCVQARSIIVAGSSRSLNTGVMQM